MRSTIGTTRLTFFSTRALSHGLRLILATLTLGGWLVFGQTPSELTIEQAIRRASENLPAVKLAYAQKLASEAEVENARVALVPRAELLFQENRASRNNVFGLLLPQAVIPSISGPVLGTAGFDSAWGSAGGLLFSWEPFDFGRRQSSINSAVAVSAQAKANADLSLFEAQGAAADAYLSALLAAGVLESVQADEIRLEKIAIVVKALVDQELKPGVDLSRIQAEIAFAKSRSIQARQTLELALETLAQAIGEPGAKLHPEIKPFLFPPGDLTPARSDFSQHPLAKAQRAAIDAVIAREKILDHSYRPRFNIQSSVFGRGTGALTDGRIDNSKGFYPDTANWAAGITINFPLTEIFSIRAKRKSELASQKVEEARYEQVIQTLGTQESRSRIISDSARSLASNAPEPLKAAKETLERAQARYQFGLTNITEVTDSERLLAQAEIELNLANLAVWRSQLTTARTRGDLQPFLQLVAQRRINTK